MHELEAVLGERHVAEARRGNRKRMDRGADVVDEARQGQLSRARAAAERVRRLDDQHRPPGPRQRDRRNQPVGARANDDGVRHRRAARLLAS